MAIKRKDRKYVNCNGAWHFSDFFSRLQKSRLGKNKARIGNRVSKTIAKRWINQ